MHPILALKGLPSRTQVRSAALQANLGHLGNPQLLQWTCSYMTGDGDNVMRLGLFSMFMIS